MVAVGVAIVVPAVVVVAAAAIVPAVAIVVDDTLIAAVPVIVAVCMALWRCIMMYHDAAYSD